MQCHTASVMSAANSASTTTTASMALTATTFAPGASPVMPADGASWSSRAVVPALLVMIDAVAVPWDVPPGIGSVPSPPKIPTVDVQAGRSKRVAASSSGWSVKPVSM